jgi:hypothetical protein
MIIPPKAKLQPLGPVLAELLSDGGYWDSQVLMPNLGRAEEVYQLRNEN